MADYSMELATRIMNFLKEEDLKYTFHEDEGVISMGVRTKSIFGLLNYIIKLRQDCFMVYAFPASLSVNGKDPEVLELICRMNYNLRNGNFELDPDDGDLRYKVYVGCSEDFLPTKDMLDDSIYWPYRMFKLYGNAIMKVALGVEKAKDAVVAAEHRLREARPTEGEAEKETEESKTEAGEGQNGTEASAETGEEGTMKKNLFGNEGGDEE